MVIFKNRTDPDEKVRSKTTMNLETASSSFTGDLSDKWIP